MKNFLRRWLGISDVVAAELAAHINADAEYREKTDPLIANASGMAASVVACVHCGNLLLRSKALAVNFVDAAGKESRGYLCQRDAHRASGRIHLAPATAIPPKGTPGKIIS